MTYDTYSFTRMKRLNWSKLLIWICTVCVRVPTVIRTYHERFSMIISSEGNENEIENENKRETRLIVLILIICDFFFFQL